MTLPHDSQSDGFTLLETMVATGVLVTALAGLAQLFALSARLTHDAGEQGAALAAAQGRIEILRSLAFTYGPLGESVTDAALTPSGGDSLVVDTDGYVDYLDAAGQPVDPAGEGHGAVWVRRWRLTAVDLFAPEALAIEVCVYRWPAAGLSPVSAAACLATVRTRQP
jgi:type II secretory pathway pseudopilin PulG